MKRGKRSTSKGPRRKSKASGDGRLTPLGAAMVAGMSAFCDAVEEGEPIEKRFTIRTARLDVEVRRYTPDDVRRVRASLNASQALLAKFLGVSLQAVRSWEQGVRPVPAIACRYMDDLLAYPDLWRRRIRIAGDGEKPARVAR